MLQSGRLWEAWAKQAFNRGWGGGGGGSVSLAPTQALPSLNQSETEGPELGGTETWPPTHGTGPKPEGKTHEAGRRPPGLLAQEPLQLAAWVSAGVLMVSKAGQGRARLGTRHPVLSISMDPNTSWGDVRASRPGEYNTHDLSPTVLDIYSMVPWPHPKNLTS